MYGTTNADAYEGSGVYGEGTGSNGIGVVGRANNGTSAFGVYGASTDGYAVYGTSTSGYGVYGASSGANGAVSGVYGEGFGSNGVGVVGRANSGANSVGVYGASTGGYAGYFQGNVRITGSCCAMGQAYTRIDDPLDPQNKYLNQSLVQSADMLSLLNGNVTTDGKGEATVTLPDWF